MPLIYVPSLLRRFSQSKARLDLRLPPSTVTELISSLEESYPGLKEQICDENGLVKRYVNVFVNGEEIRCLGGLDTIVQDQDEVFIIPAMAGG